MKPKPKDIKMNKKQVKISSTNETEQKSVKKPKEKKESDKAKDKHNCDPMIRIYEKILKIKEREREKELEKTKEKETKVDRSDDQRNVIPEVEKDTTLGNALLDLMLIKSKFRKKWNLQQATQDLPEPQKFSTLKKKLEEDTQDEVRKIWYRFVGSKIEKDTIEDEFKVVTGELPEEPEGGQEEVKVTPKQKPRMVKTTIPEVSRGQTIYSRTVAPVIPEISRKEIVEARVAEMREKDMKYIDKHRKVMAGRQVQRQRKKQIAQKSAERSPTVPDFEPQRAGDSISLDKKAPIKPVVKAKPDAFSMSTASSNESSGKGSQKKRYVDLKRPDMPTVIEDVSFGTIPSEKVRGSQFSTPDTLSTSTVDSFYLDLYPDTPLEGEAFGEGYQPLPQDELKEPIVDTPVFQTELQGEGFDDSRWKSAVAKVIQTKDEDEEPDNDSLKSAVCKVYEDQCSRSVSSTASSIIDPYDRYVKERDRKREKEKRDKDFQERLQKRWEAMDDLAYFGFRDQPVEDEFVMEEEYEALKQTQFEYLDDEEEIKEEEEEELITELAEQLEEELMMGEEMEEGMEEMIEEEQEVKKEPKKSPKKKKKKKKHTDIGTTVSSSSSSYTESESTKSEAGTKETPPGSREDVDIEKSPSLPLKARYFNPDFPELFASDTSINPSYTNLKLPYSLVCAERTRTRMEQYKKLFRNELRSLERRHPFAFGGVQLARQFIVGIRLPRRFPDPLTPKERERLEYILTHKVI